MGARCRRAEPAAVAVVAVAVAGAASARTSAMPAPKRKRTIMSPVTRPTLRTAMKPRIAMLPRTRAMPMVKKAARAVAAVVVLLIAS